MLQIVSGKFFNESINTKEVIDKDIFYSNIKIFGKSKLSYGHWKALI